MKKLKQMLWLLSILVTSLLVLSACDNDNDQQNKNDDSPADEAVAKETHEGHESGGDLIIASPHEPVSLSPQQLNDAASGNIIENIYETLTVLDDEGNTHPGLATWNQIDENTWDFYVKEDITFHDGTKLNAEVVKQNFDRLVDDKVGSPYAFLLNTADSWEIIDDFTIRIHLKYPDPEFPANLAHHATALMSPDIIEKDYEQMNADEPPGTYISQNPAGTGPFQFKKWNHGDSIVLVKHDDYWGDPAGLDSVVVKTFTDQNARTAELESESVHVADAIAPNELQPIDQAKEIHTVKKASNTVSYVGFNVQKAPFDNVKVRRALSLAINQQDIIDNVYNGIGEPARGALPPSVFEYDDTVKSSTYDVEEAKKLLLEAGYEDGFTTTFLTDGYKQHVETAETIQRQLGEIGVDVKIETLERSNYLKETAAGRQDMYIMEWTNVTDNADYSLYPLFHSSKEGTSGNCSFLKNDKLDIILQSARKETDPDVQQNLYTQAQNLLVELAPVKFIHYKENLLGVMDTVKNFSIDKNGIYQLKDTYIQQ